MSNRKLLVNKRLYEFGVFRLDTDSGLFAGEEMVNLAPKVLQTLTLLVENSGRVISKDEFFEKIWTDTFVEDNALSFNISQLRKTLARFDKDTNFVETIPKRGFRFVAGVREILPEENKTEILIERRQTREIFLEETQEEQSVSAKTALAETEPELQRFNLKTIAVGVGVAILLIALLIGFVRQFRANRDLRSFDSIRSVKLTSWASIGTSGYSNHSSSHDGNLIAYSSLRNGVSEGIFVKQFDGGEEIRITNDEWRNSNPIWSPDDKQIAFVSVRESQSGVYLCPFLGGAPTLIKIIGQGNLYLSYWTKDGSTMFYEFNGNLFRLNLSSKETTQLTDFSAESTEIKYFAVSPDENRFVFRDKIGEQMDIWIMPLGGERVRLTNDIEREVRPFWHPDGQRIFYTVRRDNHYQINAVFVNEGEPLQVKRGDTEYKMTGISGDGRKVFYATYEDKSDLWGVKTDTGEEFSVVSEAESEFWADVSPDDRLLAFQMNPLAYAPEDMKRSLIRVRTLAEKRILGSFGGYNPKWLPNGRQLAFLRNQKNENYYNLWLFDTVTGAQTQLTSAGVYQSAYALLPYNRTQIADYDWSSDSKKFIYLELTRNNIRLASSDGGEAANLTNNNNPNMTFYSPVWSPDGNRIAFVSLTNPSSDEEKAVWRVWLATTQDEPREIFKTPESLRFLGWSPGSDKMFFEMTPGAMKSSPTDVKLIEVSSEGKDKVISSFEKISALSMTLSADGANVAFSARRDGKDNIYISHAASDEPKKITNNSNSDFCFGSLKWSRDGKTIYFDKQVQIYTISMFDNFN